MRTLHPLLMTLAACATKVVAPADDADTDAADPGKPFRCPVVDDDSAFSPDPRLLRWPYVTNVTPTTASVQWGLALGTTGEIVWGEDDTFGETAAVTTAPVDLITNPLTLQTAALSGLKPGRGYCYKLLVDGVDLTGPMAFHTAPPLSTTEPVSFLVMGDYGGGVESKAGEVLTEILKHTEEFDFWVTTGDNVYGSGTWQEWEDNQFTFYRQLLRRGISYWPVPGNHDYGSVFGLTPMLVNHDLPKNAYRQEDLERYYSFDWGPVHFTMADSQMAIRQINGLDPVDDMAVWMRDDLEKSKDRPWRVAVWHHPVHMTTPGRTTDILVALHLVPIIENAGVPLQLAGHNHVYERFSHMKGTEKLASGGTTYVVTGAGGKSLYEIGEDAEDRALAEASFSTYHFMIFDADTCTITGRAIDSTGKEIDRFTLSRCD